MSNLEEQIEKLKKMVWFGAFFSFYFYYFGRDGWLVLLFFCKLFCASHVTHDGNLERFHAVTLPFVDPGYARVPPMFF